MIILIFIIMKSDVNKTFGKHVKLLHEKLNLKEDVSLKDGNINGTLIVQGHGQDGQSTPRHEFEVEFSVNIKFPNLDDTMESRIYYNESDIIEQVESAIVNGLKNSDVGYSIEG